MRTCVPCERKAEVTLLYEQNRSRQILLIDSDEVFCQVLQDVLGTAYKLRRVSTAKAGISQLDSAELDVILLNLDVQNGAASNEEILTMVRLTSEQKFAPPMIVYGWGTRQKKAVEGFRPGVADFLEQPLDVQALKFRLEAACRRADLTRDLGAAQRMLSSHRVAGLLGNSKSMARVNELIHKVSEVLTSVLITGESGTGKGVVARAIHDLGPRAKQPFVAFSACALPESLIEDELFGHEKGAFTGAIQSRRGRFEEARGGTIFLDEIGDLALPLQAKLLRVLQERSLERLGSNTSHPIDVRILCATSRNLEKMVQEGSFREDLYFRISVVRIHMPALRERTEDIPLLAEYFLKTFAQTHNKHVHGFTLDFQQALAEHHWPGNVRELQNVIERSLVLADDDEHLSLKDLPQELQGAAVPEDLPEEFSGGSFHQSVRAFKRELVRSALRMEAGNKLQAARKLGISRCYLHRLLNQLEIAPVVLEDSEETESQGVQVARSRSGNLSIASRVV
jgi:DNA-binding NtrC family response regulator